MNLELLNPHEISLCPEAVDAHLDDGTAVTCSFNRRGTLIAVGCSNGDVVIWDFATKGVVRRLTKHVRPVTTVMWSKDSRKLLTASNDRSAILWDVLASNPEYTVEFESALLGAQLHPRESDVCVVAAMMEPPILVNLRLGTKHRLPLKEAEGTKNKDAQPDKPKPPVQVVALFNQSGQHIFAGDDRGVMHVILTEAKEGMELVASWSAGKSSIKGIQLSRNGKHLLVNSADKKMRLYDADLDLQQYSVEHGTAQRKPLHTFEDSVNRNQWKCCCFSGDSDFVGAGSSTTVAHNISVWGRTSGHLEKILEGPKEGILHLEWHPTRPIIASVSTLGVVYIWSKSYTENWSAFAPDFTELEENEEYIEKEDEFDIVDWQKKEKSEVQEQEVVDVLQIDKRMDNSDSDDELFFLPTVPDRDEHGDASLAGKVEHEGRVVRHNEEIFKASQQKDGAGAKRQKTQEDV